MTRLIRSGETSTHIVRQVALDFPDRQAAVVEREILQTLRAAAHTSRGSKVPARSRCHVIHMGPRYFPPTVPVLLGEAASISSSTLPVRRHG